LDTTSTTPAIDLFEKEKIKQRNMRDLEHVLIGAGFALVITSLSLSKTNTALPWIALATAILWIVMFGIDFHKKRWIFSTIDGLTFAFFFNLALVNMPH